MPNAFQRSMQRVAKGLFGITFGGAGAESYDFAQAWVKGLFFTSGKVTAPYAQQSTVSEAIGLIAEDAAAVGWEAFRGEDRLEEHPTLDLFNRPSPNMSGLLFFVGTYVSRHLFGETFWYYPELVLPRVGGPNALNQAQGGLILLDPRRVKHKADGEEIAWSLQLGGGNQMPLESDRLTHFKRFNPYDEVRGLSKVLSVMAEVEGDFAAANWNERFFSEQNGIPAGLMLPGEKSLGMTDEQKREFLRMWNQKHGGTKRRVGMLPQGWTWQDLGQTQREMDFRALREYSREQILAMFGVPPFIAGVLDKANYANARAQKEVYWHGTITRFLREIQETINADFLPKIGITDVELWPSWEKVRALTEDLNEKADVATKFWKMGIPFVAINERLELGFNTDEIPGAEIGYLPMNLIPADQADVPMTPAGPPMLPPAEVDDDEANGNGQRSLPSGDMREERRTLVWRNLVAQIRDLEFTFQRAVRSHFEDVRKEVLRNLRGLKGWQARQTKGITLFDVDEAKRKLQKRTKPIHEAALKRGGESILASIALETSFDLLDPRVLAKVAELTGKITRIDDTVERLLRDSLGQGIEAGETVDQLAKRVNDVMDVSKTRARMIARTETGLAFNGGRYISMQQSSIDRHEWLSARDPDVRETHVAEDGNVTHIGEPFPVTGLLFPQDGSGPAGEVINCRCVALPVVED